MSFQKKELLELSFNPFESIGKEWFLLTCGDSASFNTMTASWGQVGELWGKHVLTAFVRTSRYTYEFMERGELFTVSFFDSAQKPALQFCGAHSGRDCDKAKETGLTPVSLDGTMTFAQAKLVFVCKKLYAAPLAMQAAVDPSLHKFYEKDAEHKMYIAEILAAYEQ